MRDERSVSRGWERWELNLNSDNLEIDVHAMTPSAWSVSRMCDMGAYLNCINAPLSTLNGRDLYN